MAPQELWDETDKVTSPAILVLCLLRLDSQHLPPLPLREEVLGIRNTFPFGESVAQGVRKSSRACERGWLGSAGPSIVLCSFCSLMTFPGTCVSRLCWTSWTCFVTDSGK